MRTENTQNDNLLEINLETVQDLLVTDRSSKQLGEFPTITKDPTITKNPTTSTACVEIHPTITRL